MMRTLVTALCLAFLILATPAYAQDINAQGAAHLKTMFQNIMDKQAAMYAEIEGPTVTYDGDILVEQAGDYYAITLPATNIEMPDKPKTTMKIGVISINAIPHDKPKQWKMTFTTPMPVLGYNAAGEENLRINIGQQSASGIWHEDFENFIKLDANYENITADVENAPHFMKLDKVSIIYDLSEDEAARWSGPSQMIATNLRITPPENKGYISIGKMLMSSTVDQADLLSIKNHSTLLTEAQEGQPDTAELMDAVMNYANDFGMTMKIEDLSFQDNSKDEIANILDLSIPAAPTKFNQMNLDKAHFSMEAKDLLQQKSSASVSLGYKGFSASSLDARKQIITPNNFTFELNNKNVPIRQIADMIKNAMVPEAGISNDISAALILTKVPALLAIAGTTLDIEKHLSNQTYTIDTTGTAKAELTSILGGTALITTTIKNLDQMIEATKGLMQDASNEDLGKDSKLLTTLSTLKTVGTPSQDSEGNTIHTYELVLDGTGTMTINGQPALPIILNLQSLF